MTVRVDKRKLEHLVRENTRLLDAWAGQAAGDIAQAAKDSMGSGPSTPGEPPGVDTGELRDSIEVVRDRQGRWQLRVGAEHGLYLELGTSRMAARPFVRPAMMSAPETLSNRLREGYNDV